MEQETPDVSQREGFSVVYNPQSAMKTRYKQRENVKEGPEWNKMLLLGSEVEVCPFPEGLSGCTSQK